MKKTSMLLLLLLQLSQTQAAGVVAEPKTTSVLAPTGQHRAGESGENSGQAALQNALSLPTGAPSSTSVRINYAAWSPGTFDRAAEFTGRSIDKGPARTPANAPQAAQQRHQDSAGSRMQVTARLARTAPLDLPRAQARLSALQGEQVVLRSAQTQWAGLGLPEGWQVREIAGEAARALAEDAQAEGMNWTEVYWVQGARSAEEIVNELSGALLRRGYEQTEIEDELSGALLRRGYEQTEIEDEHNVFEASYAGNGRDVVLADVAWKADRALVILSGERTLLSPA